jgi:hypothetical protein
MLGAAVEGPGHLSFASICSEPEVTGLRLGILDEFR